MFIQTTSASVMVPTPSAGLSIPSQNNTTHHPVWAIVLASVAAAVVALGLVGIYFIWSPFGRRTRASSFSCPPPRHLSFSQPSSDVTSCKSSVPVSTRQPEAIQVSDLIVVGTIDNDFGDFYDDAWSARENKTNDGVHAPDPVYLRHYDERLCANAKSYKFP